MHTLLVKKAAAIETPGPPVVEVEMAVCARVLAWKELAIRPGNESNELIIRKRLELVWRDGSRDSEFERFHKHKVGGRRAFLTPNEQKNSVHLTPERARIEGTAVHGVR